MSEQMLKATHGSAEHPLTLGDTEIPCYVLENGQRVLVEESVVKALGMHRGGNTTPLKVVRLEQFATEKGVVFTNSKVGQLSMFVSGVSIQPFVSAELLTSIINPIRFKTTLNNVANGYEATVLADICEAVLQARAAGALTPQQVRLAKQCEILVRGFARVGIIALVDEVTGYQEFRARQALEEILKKFISEELRKWVKTFPDDFYRELFRLKGLTYSEVSSKRPAYLGNITNDIVYERLAPGVLEELKRITPRTETGRLKHRLHQRLTEDIGHPKLKEHLIKLITLMKASPNWNVFNRLMERALPKYSAQMTLIPHTPDEDAALTDELL